MKAFWRFLNSRKVAVYLLLAVVVVLALSTFLPSEITLSPEEWELLQKDKPDLWWVAKNFSTPYVVRNPLILVLSLFLFLSTLVCTLSRLKAWVKTRRSEFTKEQAFSFTAEKSSAEDMETLKERMSASMQKKGWEVALSGEEGATALIEAQKGMNTGFWGSVVFHLGLLVCFLAIPVSAATVFRGQFIVTEDMTIPLKEGFISSEGRPISTLPDVAVRVSDLKGVYHKGIYKLDFSGRMSIDGREMPFSVNNPVDFRGYQLTLNEFWYSPQVVIKKKGAPIFDFFLNLRNPDKGDYFQLSTEDLVLFAFLFPDFYQEGSMLQSRSNDPNNPVLLVRFLRKGEGEVAKGLVKLGGAAEINGYAVSFPELSNWANFIVVKEWGVPLFTLGMAAGIPGLFLRFLSNERRFEATLKRSGEGTLITLKGYSRYYPAFLEREVNQIAERLAHNRDEVVL